MTRCRVICRTAHLAPGDHTGVCVGFRELIAPGSKSVGFLISSGLNLRGSPGRKAGDRSTNGAVCRPIPGLPAWAIKDPGTSRGAQYNAFTLVELLVVIGIIALLIGLLIPALTRAREQAKAAKCLSNLHQMGVAAFVYTAENRGQFPLAVASASLTVYWDFDETVPTNIRPGLLWGGKTNDPFTGYNYNTSYVGCGYGETTPLGNLRMKSAALGQLRPACAIALFGDAMSSGGTNKFMRAPILMSGTDIGDSVSISTRLAGTQGARHLGKANVCWMDGHASPVPLASNLAGQNRQGVVTYGAVSAAAGTGFLSADNTAYSGQ